MSIWIKRVAFLALAISLTATAAVAQNAAAIVKERQDTMKGLWPNFYRGFSQAAKGESADVAATPAKTQEAVATLKKVATLFPAGSGREATPDTRAKPEIWSQRSAFDAALTKLVSETQKLGDVAKTGNIEAVKAQFAAVSEACGGCHGGPAKSGGTFRFEAQ